VGEAQSDRAERVNNCRKIPAYLLKVGHYTQLFDSLSWLRPYLQIHRGMPKWLLPLLQLFWNHHQFERGKRAGSSPLELAGVKDAPALAEVLGQLFRPKTAAPPA
jgi:hypothetical protein